jgi:hypothetical protein
MTTEIAPAIDDREIVKQTLYELAEANEGRIEPDLVVEAARDESSPLHRLFTWDDSQAAERYRLLQAGALIRRIKITVLRSDPVTNSIRVENVRAIESPATERDRKGEASKGGSYIRTAKIAKDPELRASMVATALVELTAIRKRYARLSELSGVWEAIDQAEAK